MAEHAGDKTYSYKDRPITGDGVSESWYLITATSPAAGYTLNNADCDRVEIICKKSHNGSAQTTGTNDARIALSSAATANDGAYHFLAPGDSMILYVGDKSSGSNAFFHLRDGGTNCVLLVRELLS